LGGAGSSGAPLPLYGWLVCYHALSLMLGLPTLFLALRSSSPLRGLSAWLGELPGGRQDVQATQMLLGPQIAAMALPTSQIVFQQGVGNRADLMSALFGDALQAATTTGESAPAPATRQSQRSSEGSEDLAGAPAPSSPSPPWRELRRLQRQLAVLLRRRDPESQLPPAQMPLGELHAFLNALHGATSQLGVGISELQAGLTSDRLELEPQEAPIFAETLDAAARTLRALAGTVRASFPEAAAGDGRADGEEPASEGEADDAASRDEAASDAGAAGGM